jgi:hypothetical protein
MVPMYLKKLIPNTGLPKAQRVLLLGYLWPVEQSIVNMLRVIIMMAFLFHLSCYFYLPSKFSIQDLYFLKRI